MIKEQQGIAMVNQNGFQPGEAAPQRENQLADQPPREEAPSTNSKGKR